MPAGEPLLEASGVSLHFGPRAVLVDVSLSVHAGEVVSLIGPNGAGKTTLLRVLLGLLRPDRGRVAARPGLRVGYMPQTLFLDPTLPLTVRRFLTLGAGRVSPEAILADVGAAHLAQSQMRELSGGELRRVLLARALAREPELLVLDEPVQGVDVIGQAELYALIGRARERLGCGVLLVSHDLHVVMAATDRVLCLNHHVCCTGRPESVRQHPEYLVLFGPAAAEPLAVYSHVHDHRHEPGDEVVPLRSGGGGPPPAAGGRGHG